MTRRQILRQIALLLGGAVSSPVTAAVLSGSRPSPAGASAAADWSPRTLSPEQDRLVTVLAELILPATNTPGATDAEVNRFVDLMLSSWYDDDDRRRFLTGLADLEETSGELFGRPFLELAPAEQIELLEPLDRAGVEARIEAARNVGSFAADRLPFFAMMKEMTLVGYYTSEIGMSRELGYRGFSGTYSGCVAVEELG